MSDQTGTTTVNRPAGRPIRQTEAAADWAVIDRLRERNRKADPDEVLADATAAVEEVRREMYEERRRASGGR